MIQIVFLLFRVIQWILSRRQDGLDTPNGCCARHKVTHEAPLCASLGLKKRINNEFNLAEVFPFRSFTS